MSSNQKRRVGLLAFASIIVIGLVIFALIPRPRTIELQANGADIFFETNRRWVALPGGCVQVQWRAENIQTIRFENNATVGERSEQVCIERDEVFTLQIGFTDGQSTEYPLDVYVLVYNPVVWVLLVIALALILSAVVPPRVASISLRVVEVTAIWVIIVFVMLEVGFRLWVSTSGTEREKLLYLGSPAEIAAASQNYIRMPYLNYGLSPVRDDVNAMGFRGEEIALEKPAGTFRIVAMGGSTTFGDGLDWNETWAAQLQAVLRDDFGYESVEVINAGVPSYTTWHSLINFQFRVSELEPDLVMIYHAVNDSVAMSLLSAECHRGNNANLGLGLTSEWVFEQPDMGPSAFYRFMALRLGWMRDPSTFDFSVDFFGALGCDNSLDRRVMNPPDYFERNMGYLVNAIQSEDIPVLISTWAYRNVQDIPADETVSLASIPDFNAVLVDISEEKDTLLFDLASELEFNADYWQTDMVHQTAEGAKRQAELYAAFIDESGLIR